MIGKDKKKKFSSSVNVAILTFFSRVFGYLRDLTITFFFGANTLTDSFYVAFRIPNLFRRLVAEGTLSSTLVPFFTKYANSKDENSYKKFSDLFYLQAKQIGKNPQTVTYAIDNIISFHQQTSWHSKYNVFH